MPKIKIKNNASMYYEEYGVGDGDDKRETIVFVGGFTADHFAWNAAARLCSTKYRTIIFDNRGVGQSDCPPTPYTLELMVDDIKELCEALGIKQAYFVGNSLGGQIVMMLTHRYPALVKAAVVSNSAIKPGSFIVGLMALFEAQLALLRLIESQNAESQGAEGQSVDGNNVDGKNIDGQNALSVKLKEIFVKTNLGWIFSDDFLSRPGMIELLVRAHVENKHPITAMGFTNQLNAFMISDISALLKDIKCPCLVITSEGDRTVPVAETKKIADATPGAQYLLFPGKVGHLPHIEQPEKFCQILFDFIDACRGR
jgi:3-oxoadipate enol-lactonase